MSNFNRVILSGYLGADPETRAAGDTTATHFNLAVTDRWKDADDKPKSHTNWVPVVTWNGQGETIAEILTKGSHVLVEGMLRVTSWDDKESGQKRWRTEVIASRVVFLDKKSQVGTTRPRAVK